MSPDYCVYSTLSFFLLWAEFDDKRYDTFYESLKSLIISKVKQILKRSLTTTIMIACKFACRLPACDSGSVVVVDTRWCRESEKILTLWTSSCCNPRRCGSREWKSRSTVTSSRNRFLIWSPNREIYLHYWKVEIFFQFLVWTEMKPSICRFIDSYYSFFSLEIQGRGFESHCCPWKG